MKNNHLNNSSLVIRAWKDKAFRQSLSDSELAALPHHPSGNIELSDDDLAMISGGAIKKTENWACSLPTLICKQTGC